MSGSSAADIKKHLRVYYLVFGALAFLTIVTVAVAEFRFLTVPQAIGVALLVATIKGSLVACYFMHLLTERGLVFWVLILCALFFVVLMLLPVVTISEGAGVSTAPRAAAATHGH